MGTLVPGGSVDIDGYVDTAAGGGMLLEMYTDRTPWIVWAGPMESILGEGCREMSKDSMVIGESVEVSVASSRRRSKSVRTWSGVLGAFSISSAIVLETGGDGRCAVPALLPGWQAYIRVSPPRS